MINYLEVFDGAKVKAGARVWDYGVDGTKILGEIVFTEDTFFVHWDEDSAGTNMVILNPLQLHKI